MADSALDGLLGQREKFLAFVRREAGDAAEDIVQAAYVKAMQSLPSLRDEARAEAWFYQILRNAIVDHHRRTSSAHKAAEALADEPLEAVEPARRICGCALKALSDLKPEYEAIVRAVDVEGAPVEAAAARLGISANNASVRLFRGRRALREGLVARCRDCCGSSGYSDCYCGA